MSELGPTVPPPVPELGAPRHVEVCQSVSLADAVQMIIGDWTIWACQILEDRGVRPGNEADICQRQRCRMDGLEKVE